MVSAPLMPKATAVWLVDNTSLTFEQIADFCQLHELEVKGIADGDVAQGIRGMDPMVSGQLVRDELERAESDALLRFLFEHMNRPEFHVRFKWREDDLAIWDNRATQHYATGDYYPEYRRMHRITVGGDRPAGITEQTPEALQSAG